MSDVSFYHLTRQPLERALPKLLERVVGSDLKAVVRVGGEERLAALDSLLWTYTPDSFLPHGTAKSGHADIQPVYLTMGDENPASAEVLMLVDGVEADDVADFARCLYMFDGNDEAAVTAARGYWSRLKQDGHDVTYWRQSDAGRWEKQA